MAKKNSFEENLEYFLLLPFLGIIRLLPLKIAFSLATFAAKIGFIVDRRHRRRAIQHLLHAGITDNLKEAKKLALASFIHFAKVGIEVIKIDQYISGDNITDYVTLRCEPDGCKKALDNASAVIYAGAHYGNWEISGLASSMIIRPIVSVMRPFDNKKIGDYITSRRSMFNQEVCDKNSAIKPLLKAISQGKAVGILSDQHAGRTVGVETIFFGHPARTHISPALLSLKTNASLFVGIAKRINDNFKYDLRIIGPIKLDQLSSNKEQDIQLLAQKYTSIIEEEIRKDPTQWIWCHRRWLDINRK